MLPEKMLNFFKKNGALILQVSVLSLPFVIFAFYFEMGDESDVTDVPSIEKVESKIEAAQKVDKPKEEKKEESSSDKKEDNKKEKLDSAAFEIDEVSQEMLDKSAANPQEAFSENSACKSFENVHTIAKHTGTISKAKNIDKFKKPLPAMITETEYTCVDAAGGKKVKFATMGVAVDAETNMLRCVQSNSDETLTNEARFKHVLKIMTHHCGFKLSEHRSNEPAAPTMKLSDVKPLDKTP